MLVAAGHVEHAIAVGETKHDDLGLEDGIGKRDDLGVVFRFGDERLNIVAVCAQTTPTSRSPPSAAA